MATKSHSGSGSRRKNRPRSENQQPVVTAAPQHVAEQHASAAHEHVLPRVRLLQLGDIHLPSSATSPANIDGKDQKFSPALKNIISRNPLKTVFRRVYEIIDGHEIDAVLFMGDFTDVGDPEGYRACCAYVAGALQLGRHGRHSGVLVGVVPGNHDISRPLARKTGLISKFQPIAAALRDAGLPPPPIELPVTLAVGKGGHTADVHLLNSCWGCGEDEYIPELFRKPIAQAIASVLNGEEAAGAARLYYDYQLDTPAISADAIERVVSIVRNSPLSRVPVVVAHHNILPQRITRLAPYTELVNSGALRSSLMELARPTIFLHGHIHDSTIEVISLPHGSPLVSISAPELVRGFNIVELIFTPSGLPLLSRILPWRFDGSGVLRSQPQVSVSLIANRRRSSNPVLGQFFSKLMDHAQCYWSDVMSCASAIKSGITPIEVIEMLELLAADQSIMIENHDLPFSHWLVRAEV
jgi:Calcineurin-like phosphoesterase